MYENKLRNSWHLMIKDSSRYASNCLHELVLALADSEVEVRGCVAS